MHTIQRRLLPIVRTRMAESPVLLLEGPRSVSKSTPLTEIASEATHARTFDFDDTEVFALAQQGLALITHEQTPVFVDEYKWVPDILQAIKSRLSVETQPGVRPCRVSKL